MPRVRRTRLQTAEARIDVRWASFDGRWIASADTPDGPTLGVGGTPQEALTAALAPFGDASDGGAAPSRDDAERRAP